MRMSIAIHFSHIKFPLVEAGSSAISSPMEAKSSAVVCETVNLFAWNSNVNRR